MQQKILVADIRFTFVKKVYHINVILLPLFHILPQLHKHTLDTQKDIKTRTLDNLLFLQFREGMILKIKRNDL